MERKLTFEIEIEEIKSKDEFLRLLDKVLAYKFVKSYNDNNITGKLHRKEKNKHGKRTTT